MKQFQLKQIGTFIKVHGIRGEMVLNLEDSLTCELIENILTEGEPVFVEKDGIPVPFFISKDGFSELNQNNILIKLDDIDDKRAIKMVSSNVLIDKSKLSDIEENLFGSPEELVGYTVIDKRSNFSGEITEFINLKENPMLNVKVEKKNMLLPVISDFFVSVDDKKKIIILNLPDGYIEAML
jgi:16S rRNA processing protein RimM